MRLRKLLLAAVIAPALLSAFLAGARAEDCSLMPGQPSPCSGKPLRSELVCIPRAWEDKINARDEAEAEAVELLGKCRSALSACTAEKQEQPSRVVWFTGGLAAGIAATIILVVVVRGGE